MRKGFTLIELMIVIAIIAIIAAIAIPGLLAAQRSANQRNASASLKTIPTAEADFRSNDRDGDLQNNFWVGPLFGLYALNPSTDGGATAPAAATAAAMIKVVEPSIAGADGAINAGGGGLVTPTLAVSTVRSPKSGYVFTMLSRDDSSAAGALYADTVVAGQAYSGFHNFGRFAVITVPVSRGTGTQMYAVNEDATIYRLELNTAYVATFGGAWTGIGLTGIASMTTTNGTNTMD